MPTIKQLPPLLVNKIAAGEVIERPASVVKELLENAVDAQASRIDVSVRQGGADLVAVVDNGCGIEADQLPLAVASHATSKIHDTDDLFRVQTLGFRGEALASIAAVSQLRLRSRTSGMDEGAELEVNGGHLEQVAPCGCPVGTAIQVRNLFHNTPVRRKFLRTTQTEMGHITEAFTRIALASPKVHFTLRHNDRCLFDLPAADCWRERITAFFGSELVQGLIWIESEDGPVRVSGYVANPSHSRANNRMQYLLLNGRHIRDRSLQHALGEAYRGLLLSGRYPIAFLRLEMPPDAVDVNVHPTKLEVRFQDSGRMYSQLLGTLRTRFLTTDLTTHIEPAASSLSQQEPAVAQDPSSVSQVREEFVHWAKGQLPPAQPIANAPRVDEPHQANRPGDVDMDFGAPRHSRLKLQQLDHPWEPVMDRAIGQQPAQQSGEGFAEQNLSMPPAEATGAARAIQVHNRYLVTETDKGVVVIDQHALHERILYEQLKEKVLANQTETQQLLVPEPVQLTASEAAAVLDARELLAQLGIEVQPFGGSTVLISSYPAMLANLSPEELLRQLIEQLLEGGKAPDRGDLLDELLQMISCKAAIKAGDRLSGEEISALLAQRHLVDDSHHCPHGRPTALVFTREELDRRFMRI